MAIVASLFLRALPYIAAIALAWYGWHRADTWCNSACRDQRSQVEKIRSQSAQLTEQIRAAQQRATDLALQWAQQVDKADEAARQARNANAQVFAGLADDARRLPAGGHLSISPAARRVFDGITAAANDQPPADPPRVEPAPEAVSCIPEREAAIAWAQAAEAYRDATSLLEQTRRWYEGIRNANP